MNRLIFCTSLTLALALPTVSEAHGHRGGHDERGGHHEWGEPGRAIGHVIALPFIVGAAVVGAAVSIVAAPFYAAAPPPAPVYGPQPEAYYQQQPYAPAYYPQPQIYYAPSPYDSPRPIYPGDE